MCIRDSSQGECEQGHEDEGALLALTLGIGAYAGVARRLTGLLKVLLPIVAVMFALQVAFTPTRCV